MPTPKNPDIAGRFWSKVERRDGDDCWPWIAGIGRWGYGIFDLHGKAENAQRVAWFLTHGEIPAGLSVLHRCDNPPCVNPAHLFLGTHHENMTDKASKLRSSVGVRNHFAKLSDADVAAIKARLSAGERKQAIADAFSVSYSLVWRIARGLNWKHVA